MRGDVLTGDDLMSPRQASNIVEKFDNVTYAVGSSAENGEAKKLNIFFLFWGQIIGHDMGKLALVQPGGEHV